MLFLHIFYKNVQCDQGLLVDLHLILMLMRLSLDVAEQSLYDEIVINENILGEVLTELADQLDSGSFDLTQRGLQAWNDIGVDDFVEMYPHGDCTALHDAGKNQIGGALTISIGV